MEKNKEKINIDIFCDIIDNYGDIGFVYRLAREIKKKEKNIGIRVFLNDLKSFKVINSKVLLDQKIQNIDNIDYINLNKLSKKDYESIIPSEVAIEAFACEIARDYFINYKKKLKLIINLEYFTLEEWTKDFHLHSSFIDLKGVAKYFYMPGIEKDRGGVIISTEEKIDKKSFIQIIEENSNYNFDFSELGEDIFATIFSYEFNFDSFLINLEVYSKKINKKIYLLVFGEKSQRGFPRNYKSENIKIIFMNYVEQGIYDKIINYTDFNLVRGEESFVRALLSGKAFLWQAYCQENEVHLEKVKGFLDLVEKFFPTKKSFVNYSKIMYNYNSRRENGYNITKLDFSDFLENKQELDGIFERIKEFIIKNGNLVDKLLEFIYCKM